jgi:hypothetical protein
VEYGLPTVCIQMAQEVLAHLLVINIIVCSICFNKSAFSVYSFSMQFIKQTFLVPCFTAFLVYRDDFRQSSIVKHDKQIVFLSIKISLVLCMRALLYYTQV